ncbi:kinase-like domain-containing protein [Scheffersomyces amazonensis]|uniref:kinase-like domain-containing protein n=1 Tax=Scheffersomyces amazonensis TaxID=1078765 RepID=UPI00315DAEBE
MYLEKNQQVIWQQKSKLCSSDEEFIIPLHLNKVILIGRDANKCNLVIKNPMVSSVHAIVWAIKFDNHTPALIYIRDNSTNGVLINGNLIGKNNTRMLFGNDSIDLRGGIIMKVSTSTSTSTFSHPLITIGKWEISNNLVGQGTFGSVYIANKTEENSLFAVKHIKPSQERVRVSEREKERFKAEAELLLSVNHTHIIRVHEAIVSNNELYIFQDLVCGGDLFSYLVSGDRIAAIPEIETIVIIFQILKALEFLHNTLNIIHRDLKLDNILLEAPLPFTRIYICDFGIAKKLGNISQRCKTMVGTVEYSAPEIFSNHYNSQGYTSKCDIWSLGIICHIMLSGVSPFYSDKSNDEMINKASLGTLNFELLQFQGVSNKAKCFIKSLIQIMPEDRPNIEECFNINWIKLNRDLLDRVYKEKVLGSYGY